MRCITLVENTYGRNDCIAEHGLSIYIETNKHKLLLDTGQTDAVMANAKTLGIDLSLVDTIILSHGHYDHSGGILPFTSVNKTADIYMQSSACEPHYNGERYIGIDPEICSLKQLKCLDGDRQIDDELYLFTGIHARRFFPEGNRKLLMLENGQKVFDDFRHEQCLVISQNNKKVLLSGCAHNGILNILDRYNEIFGGYPDYAITGFHMMKREAEHSAEEIKTIEKTAFELTKLNTIFYSGHCTGIPAFERMKKIMGSQLHAIHSGEEIKLDI